MVLSICNETTSEKGMSSCENFTENAWRPDLCSICQRSRVEHEGHQSKVGGGSRSWRRRSEPDPSNSISGSKISTLASKFQGRETRSGSLKESIPDCTNGPSISDPTVKSASRQTKTSQERKTSPSSHARLNNSRSADLLDISAKETPFSPSSPSSNTTVSSKISAISSALSEDHSVSKSSSLSSSRNIGGESVLSSSKSTKSNSVLSSSSSSSTTTTITIGSKSSSVKPHNPSSQKPVPATNRKLSLPLSSSSSSSSTTTRTTTANSANPKPRTASKNPQPDRASLAPKPKLTNAPAKSNLISSTTTPHTNSTNKKVVSILSSSSSNSSSSSLSSSSSSVKPALSQKHQPTPSQEDNSQKTQKQKKLGARRVSFPEEEFVVIGTDGGIDNLIPEQGTTDPGNTGSCDIEDGKDQSLSLTEEEKQFALLALGNTVWNSDTRNLQVGTDLPKRSCREFEDLPLDLLWEGERFKSLSDCDGLSALKAHPQFNSYPLISGGKPRTPSSAKISVQSIGKSGGGKLKKGGSEETTNTATRDLSINNTTNTSNSCGNAAMERLKGERWSAVTSTSGSSSVTSLNSDVDGGVKGHSQSYGSSSGSADSGVEMGTGSRSNSVSSKDRPLSYTLGDITDCLYEAVDEIVPEKQRIERACSDGASKAYAKDRPLIKTKPIKGSVDDDGNDDSNVDEGNVSSKREENPEMVESGFSFPDEMERLDMSLTMFEGFKAIALLNDVLQDYSDLNESSTDDAFVSAAVTANTADGSSVDATKKEINPGKAKKSSAFEARMASVAAGLDLSKQQQQQQRIKRQAPRPPVSPPPEPINIGQGVSPKKTPNPPDPVFKMVPVGKSILQIPVQSDIPKQPAKPNLAPVGLEDFSVNSSETPDSPGGVKSNGDGAGGKKKGFTSFFKNILRRGKDSPDSFESANPDVQFNAKPEEGGNGSNSKSKNNPLVGSVADGAGDGKNSSDKSAPDFHTIPSNSASLSTSSSSSSSSASTSEFSSKKSSSTVVEESLGTKTTSAQPSNDNSTPSSCSTTTATTKSLSSSTATTIAPSLLPPSTTVLASSSPPTQKKSKGMPSPKMMLKRATAKFSPPANRRLNHKSSTEKETVDQQTSPPSSTTATTSSVLPTASTTTASTIPKPYPAPKPTLPSGKPSSSSTTTTTTTTTSGKESAQAPSVVRRRAKSPKTTAPPVPPTRVGVPPGSATSSAVPSPMTRSEHRESTRRSMPVPPPSPPREKPPPLSTITSASAPEHTSPPSPPISPIPETENSLPSSPSSPTASFDFQMSHWSGGSTSTMEDEPMTTKFVEKIELPTVANQGRKGILGKLSSVNRKNKAPHPPSVKRAKSITESSTLPRGDKSKNKRINAADISGPVMVQDVTGSHVLENRRNTISLGDDPAIQAIASFSSGQSSGDKESFDEFDMPILSPLGSLENLYESILPKSDGSSFHYYDPPTGPQRPLCPNIPAEGYLEPVPPASLVAAVAAAAAAAAASTASTSQSTDTNSTTPSVPMDSLSTSASTSVSASMTNISVVKSPSKSDPVKRKSNTSKSLDNVFDSHDPSKTSSSSESNSAENSGSSLPDSFFQALHKSNQNQTNTGSGLGVSFVEPEMTDQRRTLLASQPIYEEIPNGVNEEKEDLVTESGGVKVNKGKLSMKSDDRATKTQQQKKSVEGSGSMSASFHSSGLPKGIKETPSVMSKSQFLQPPLPPPQTQLTTPSSLKASTTSLSSSSATLTATPQSLHHSSPSKHISRQTSSSSLMTTSLTSSMLPPPPPPPDHLPVPPTSMSTVRSLSRETMAASTITADSESHTSFCTLPRPRAAPRRKAKRPDTTGSDQYVSMNKPNLQVSLSEDKLRDLLNRMSGLTFQSLQEIYVQFEKILSVDKLGISQNQQVTWNDLDVYGKPVHASGKCVIYNAKLKSCGQSCQVMSLHPSPHTDLHPSVRPSLLRLSAVFLHAVPFSFLTPDFIKTAQLLQNCVYDSTEARCLVTVGKFDIVESLDSHLSLLRETMASDQQAYLNVILTIALQLLSAMSHCLDQGFAVTETDYHDVFLISRSDLRGKVVAFLPQHRSSDVPQGEAMCNFVDRLLTSAFPLFTLGVDDDEDDDDDDDDEEEEEENRLISAPKRVVAKLRLMLEDKRVENLGQVRTAIEYLLWGPRKSDLPISPTGGGAKPSFDAANGGEGGGASKEQELYMWLEVQRSQMVGQLASREGGLNAGLSVEEFYRLKFLLKTSAMSLTESLRRLLR